MHLALLACLVSTMACQSTRQHAGGGFANKRVTTRPESDVSQTDSRPHGTAQPVTLVTYQENDESRQDREAIPPPATSLPLATDASFELAATRSSLEANALAANPSLRKLQHQAMAASARVRYAGKLPDPTIGAVVFGDPIETAAGSQRANLTLTQMLPWLARLDAQTQQACFEALALRQLYFAERAKVLGQLRVAWFSLYVLHKQIEVNRANQQLLRTLTDLANARLRQNIGTAGDVSLGLLEISRVEEQHVALIQRVESTRAELNRLAGRAAQAPVAPVEQIDAKLPAWSPELLQQLAWNWQPELTAARLRTQATRWGVEVAKLKRRPDTSFGASWFFIDDNRPATPVVTVGEDAWSLGAQVSIPLWRKDYDAMRSEATWTHFASHASVEDLGQRYDALLVDLWEQARAAHETARLFRDTMIPQARQTLAADQQALQDGAVEFDRVIRDVRNLLELEFGYHRSTGQLAALVARIQAAVGVDLDTVDLGKVPAAAAGS